MAEKDEGRPVATRVGRWTGIDLRSTYLVLGAATAVAVAMVRKDGQLDIEVGPYDDDLLRAGSGVWVKGETQAVEAFNEKLTKKLKQRKIKAAWTYYQPTAAER